jgi:M6 family metalloprotease-like protein
MSNEKSKLALFFLLLLVFVTAAAEDAVSHRGCRLGTPRPHNQLLRRSTAQTRQPGGDFYQGNRHQLVVLAAFADCQFKGNESATLEQWNKIFNTENYAEGSFRGSIRDYFYAQSYGKFNLTFDLVYVTVGNVVKYRSWDKDYGDATDDDENSQYLVQDIMEQLKQNTTIDWSRYDWNGDGYVNQFLIVYAGKGMNDGGGKNSVWPHQWWMGEHLKDRQPGVYCDPIAVTYGHKQYLVDCYCALSELGNAGDYSSFGVICHEYTHCFGFPDFYNHSGTPRDWDIMDHAYYDSRAFCPVSYSAHERWLMGWLTPTELTSAATVTSMPALSDEPVAYLIRNDGYEQEYYMVENRQKRGWDAQLPGSGLVIFHVDFDADTWTGVNGETANPGSKDRYLIFAANNSPQYSSSSGWPYPYSGNNSLTDTSSPAATLNKSNGGKYLMSKPITNIQVTSGAASFDFMGGAPSSIQAPVSASSHQVLYDIGPVRIVRMSNGEIKKVMKR